MKNKRGLTGCLNQIRLSFPRNVVGNLPLSESLVKEEIQPYFIKQVKDPRQKLSGMITNFNNFGFTLIELLVVVLIIGILAAVAMPQYQKAVEKARASEALPILKSVYQAAQTYQMANGEWPTKFDELAVEIPWTGTTKWRNYAGAKDTRSNHLWSIQLYTEGTRYHDIYLGRISGRYEGAGFVISSSGDWACAEKTSDGKVFNGNPGDYCVKIMRCPNTPTTYDNGRYYPYKP